MYGITSPLDGGPQTGFTDPEFTLTTDVAPDINGEQVAVTTIGGTGLGSVRSHTISDPFTITFSRPKNPRILPQANPVTGRYGSIPRNTYTMIVRKGLNVASGQAPEVGIARVTLDIPAGADAYDQPNVRALVSALIGALSQQSAGIGDTAVTGIL